MSSLETAPAEHACVRIDNLTKRVVTEPKLSFVIVGTSTVDQWLMSNSKQAKMRSRIVRLISREDYGGYSTTEQFERRK